MSYGRGENGFLTHRAITPVINAAPVPHGLQRQEMPAWRLACRSIF